MGAMTGLWLAIHAAERIDRLALCCTSPRLGPLEMWAERAATVRSQGMEAIVEAQLDRWFTPEFCASGGVALQRTRRAFLATPAEGYAACCEAIAAFDVRGELASVRAPTLVVSASGDEATPPDHGRSIANGIDGARFVLLDDTRHLTAVERPHAVGDAVLDHLIP